MSRRDRQEDAYSVLVYVTVFGSAIAALSCAWNGLFWSTVALVTVCVCAFVLGLLEPWRS